MKLKKVISIGMLTAIVMATAMINTSFAQYSRANTSDITNSQGIAKVTSKDEVVYANLTAEGKTKAVYVVNHFEVEQGGEIEDYGN